MCEYYELLRVFDRQHLQQHGINEAEDRRVRPNSQSQRQNDDSRESGVLTKLTNGETKVVKHSG